MFLRKGQAIYRLDRFSKMQELSPHRQSPISCLTLAYQRILRFLCGNQVITDKVPCSDCCMAIYCDHRHKNAHCAAHEPSCNGVVQSIEHLAIWVQILRDSQGDDVAILSTRFFWVALAMAGYRCDVEAKHRSVCGEEALRLLAQLRQRQWAHRLDDARHRQVARPQQPARRVARVVEVDAHLEHAAGGDAEVAAEGRRGRKLRIRSWRMDKMELADLKHVALAVGWRENACGDVW